jgi:hypothetical protein
LSRDLPRTFRGGLCVRLFENRFLILADLLKTDYMDADFQGGVEIRLLDNLLLRGGHDTLHEQSSFGLGVVRDNWQIDYAFLTHDLGATSVLSATMRFGIVDGVRVVRDKARFSPSGNYRNVELEISTAVKGGIDKWRLEFRDVAGRTVRLMTGKGAPPQTLTWGGEDDQGRLVRDGTYQAVMVIHDSLDQSWRSMTAVDILGFRDRTRTPIHIDVSGHESRTDDGDER